MSEIDSDERESPAKTYPKPKYDRFTFSYDVLVFIFSIVFGFFFREVQTRGLFNVPSKGPVILVIAPHANQFVDPGLLFIQIKHQLGRRISYVEAASSFRTKIIGTMSKMIRAIPVERAQDLLKPATGSIRIDQNDALVVIGTNTKFTEECQKKGLLGLPHSAGNCQIDEVIDDTKILLVKGFKGDKALQMLKQGTSFKTAPRVDNSHVFQHVFNHLHEGGIVGIFPEGGSHDRTTLLPIKAGVAIMALGAVADDDTCEVKVIPCGLNYFHRNKFRSRAVIEFGAPIMVTKQDGLDYKENSRETVSRLLETVTLGLKAVTVTTPDYDTLMIIQATRRLYTFRNRNEIPLPVVVDMNRRLAIGYDMYKEDPRVMQLKESVRAYNTNLYQLGIKDHQVEDADNDKLRCLVVLLARVLMVLIYLLLSLPGTILFSPVFIVTKRISKRKAKEALDKSVVKIKANDVVATWKILVAMAFAPALYILYSVCSLVICSVYGVFPGYGRVILFFVFYAFFCFMTYSAFKIGEVGMDIFKSLAPLVLSLSSSKQIMELKETRRKLALEVTELCNDLGPKVFPDFNRVVAKEDNEDDFEHVERFTMDASDTESIRSETTITSSNAISRVGSSKSLSDIPIFSYYGERSDTGEDVVPIDDIGRETHTSSLGIRIRTATRKKIQEQYEQKEEEEEEEED